MLEGYLPDGEGGGGLDGRHGVLVFCSLATLLLATGYGTYGTPEP